MASKYACVNFSVVHGEMLLLPHSPVQNCKLRDKLQVLMMSNPFWLLGYLDLNQEPTQKGKNDLNQERFSIMGFKMKIY